MENNQQREKRLREGFEKQFPITGSDKYGFFITVNPEAILDYWIAQMALQRKEVAAEILKDAENSYYFAWKHDYNEPDFDGVNKQLTERFIKD